MKGIGKLLPNYYQNISILLKYDAIWIQEILLDADIRGDRVYDKGMSKKIEIRKSLQSDLASLEELYPAAFPDEDLLPLLRELLQERTNVLSLVGIAGSTLVGHIAFTTCSIAGHTDKVALLGPLAVTPAWQRQGIGRAIVHEGSKWMEKANVTRVYVLGDPAYYGRLGFAPETGVTPPYPLPAEWNGAWQSLQLSSAKQTLLGELSVPQPWRQPDLWAP